MSITTVPLGIEIEYMLVDPESLAVSSVAEDVLAFLSGTPGASDALGPVVSWSNELVAHVLESKVTKPLVLSDTTMVEYAAAVQGVVERLKKSGARLLPSAAHPWMNPATDARLWSGEWAEHYQVYHQNFNCFTHGFANLQSVHINIPFHSEAEFGRLLQAIRLVLPLIPALAASSPFLEGVVQPEKDARLRVYATNQKKIPEIIGQIIPEEIYTYAAYKHDILEKMYAAIEDLYSAETLQTEQLNSRGCIARFDRNTLEIRLCDSQESVVADFAVVYGVMQLLNWVLTEAEKNPNHAALKLPEGVLKEMLLLCAKDAEKTYVREKEYLDLFGFSQPVMTEKLWQEVAARARREMEENQLDTCKELQEAFETLVKKGTLASRLRARFPDSGPGDAIAVDALRPVYLQLAETLESNSFF